MSNQKIEDMLTQLIKIVGTIQVDFQEMKAEMKEMREEMKEIREEMNEMKEEMVEMKAQIQELDKKVTHIESKVLQLEITGDERHKEIMNQFKTVECDQNFIWEKTVRNERDIAAIKGQLS